jgi:predicted TIM-barrel fold metal-dependent hydrolase
VIIRRNFLKMFGAGGAAGLFAARDVGAPAPAGQRARAAASGPRQLDASVGALDLNHVELVDTHVHPPHRMTLKQSYDMWNDSFVDAMVPDYDFPGKKELRAKLTTEFVDQIWDLPRQTGYNNYMARIYGVPPTLEGFDSVVSKHIKSDTDFTAYVKSILDRENISTVVLQSAEADPILPPSSIPRDRFVWTYPIVPLVHPAWAQKKSATTLQDVLDQIDKTIETAVANRCVAFKNAAAYYRTLGFDRVEKRDAETAFKALMAATPAGHVAQGAPYYKEPAVNAALKTYQDFLFKHIYVKAGQVERPIVIHTAVALHPALRFEYNNPLALYDVFQDDEVRKAATRFVLFHTGYPSHHAVASMISQFPNVFVDMSFYAKFPGVLEETYRAFLGLAPSEKVMHGSDSNNVPEEIGYCASNTRLVLARVLHDYKTYYGWTQADITKIADNVMHKNARRLFRIPEATRAS